MYAFLFSNGLLFACGVCGLSWLEGGHGVAVTEATLGLLYALLACVSLWPPVGCLAVNEYGKRLSVDNHGGSGVW